MNDKRWEEIEQMAVHTHAACGGGQECGYRDALGELLQFAEALESTLSAALAEIHYNHGCDATCEAVYHAALREAEQTSYNRGPCPVHGLNFSSCSDCLTQRETALLLALDNLRKDYAELLGTVTRLTLDLGDKEERVEALETVLRIAKDRIRNGPHGIQAWQGDMLKKIEAALRGSCPTCGEAMDGIQHGRSECNVDLRGGRTG